MSSKVPNFTSPNFRNSRPSSKSVAGRFVLPALHNFNVQLNNSGHNEMYQLCVLSKVTFVNLGHANLETWFEDTFV